MLDAYPGFIPLPLSSCPTEPLLSSNTKLSPLCDFKEAHIIFSSNNRSW